MTLDEFDTITRHCELYTGRAWDGTLDHLATCTARQAEAVEILRSHNEWLSGCKARVECAGERWNTSSCRAQSRRDGDLAAPPEWIGRLSEELTPERLLNR